MYVYLGPGSKVVRHAFQTATESVYGWPVVQQISRKTEH